MSGKTSVSKGAREREMFEHKEGEVCILICMMIVRGVGGRKRGRQGSAEAKAPNARRICRSER